MNTQAAAPRVADDIGDEHDLAGSLEAHGSHELVRDEDVLSRELQRELEAVGSALGVIAVMALVAAALPRARLLINRTPFADAGTKEESHG